MKTIFALSVFLFSFPAFGAKKPGDQEAIGQAKVTCDREVCRIELPNLKISAGQSLYALKEDCDWADIIVVPGKKMKSCGRADIYDRWRFMKTGALAIMTDGTIKTVREEQGNRPWSTWLIDKPYKSANN